MDDVVQTGVELLKTLDHDELPMADIVDRLEMVTGHPEHVREIIDHADKEGVIDRGDGVVYPSGDSSGNFDLDDDIVVKDGDFSCRRCGRSITTGYFMKLSTTEFGPFGSTCIRKVTGREE